jgi:hypothetical protein
MQSAIKSAAKEINQAQDKRKGEALRLLQLDAM